ncbi:MAG: cation transporter [Candidatus Thiodiazotropha lotti]|nr:cation transporter [Candidatus Thiodiazotropha lotti]MCG7998124.1 cation transporter [Candidatus Thiodiazotropha lotti]MCW4185021.1 cation transporter [Candidatus Thiodiazotropha weberae]MCW4189889.1 cation transporter [Candidatus Thiodiazotropha weberae]
MSGCCDGGCSVNALQEERQRGTLKTVLGINAIMFIVIVGAAIYGDSTALLANSFDNFGDALTYALSLFAISRGNNMKAKIAFFKGVLILLAAIIVTTQIIYKLFVPGVPVFEAMGIFGILSLIANSICLFLLWRHRHEDVNMSSVWECSRNDIASDLSVIIAAGAVWLSGSGWPDIIVALVLVILLYRSAFRVISSAKAELHNSTIQTDY